MRNCSRDLPVLRFLCCPDAQGSHREPCHLVADGNRPANTHLFDGCTQPYGSWQGLESVMSDNCKMKGQ